MIETTRQFFSRSFAGRGVNCRSRNKKFQKEQHEFNEENTNLFTQNILSILDNIYLVINTECLK